MPLSLSRIPAMALTTAGPMINGEPGAGQLPN